MAALDAPQTASFALNSHATALCITPPQHCWAPIDRLRSLYDKAYRKWPPHVNLVYPFVQPERLDAASQQLQRFLKSETPEPFDASLNTAGVFTHRHEKTLFLRDGRNDESAGPLLKLQAGLVAALEGHDDFEKNKGFRMHMTVAQSSESTSYTSPSSGVDGPDADAIPEDTFGNAHRFLLHKVENMPPVTWQVDRLHILVREQPATADIQHSGRETHALSSRMRLWGVLHLDGTVEKLERSTPFYEQLLADSTGPSADDIADDFPVSNAVTYTPEGDEWVSNDDDEDGSHDDLAADVTKAEQQDLASQHIAPDVEKLIVPVEPVHAPAGPLSDPVAVVSALDELGAIPSDDDIARRKAAFERLKAILLNEAQDAKTASATSRLPRQLVVVPAGSYGLGVWTPASDIDCLCIGAFGAQTFFALASQRLRAAGAAANGDAESSVRIIRRSRAHTGPMLVLEVNGIRMNLQYCSAGRIAETWPSALVLPPAHPIFAISPLILFKLKAVRDLYYIHTSFPETSAFSDASAISGHCVCTASNFQTAHRAIKAWACSRGLYAARFGYLGGIQIAILLARVIKLMQRAISKTAAVDAEVPYTVADILVTFFQHYADFDWKTKMAFDPFFHSQVSPYTPSGREPLTILGYHRPQLNTGMTASVLSVRVLAEEFQRASHLLRKDASDLTWRKFLRGGDGTTNDSNRLPPGPAEFVRAYRSYVKIDLQYWGLSLSKGSAFVGWLESRCVLLLVNLARRLPELNAHIWPGRFVEVDDTDDDDSKDSVGRDRQYQGCYLVGLDLPESMTRDERRVALGTLQSVLAHFEKQIRDADDGHGNATSFDPKWQWIGINIVSRADLGNASRLRLDSRPWGEYTLGDDEDDEDEDDHDAEDSDHEPASKKSKGKDKDRKKLPMAVVHRPNSSTKFRTAQDVIKRLRWDPHLDRSDFIVGYEDRFLGARERPLELWKSEQTDEEFIPQHRIVYFRQRSDGAIVWDRRSRKDAIFGSGAPQTE